MPATDVGTSEDLLAELSAWVKMETPTTDGAAVNRLMDVAERELTRAGAAMTRIPGRDGYGDNLIARTPGEGKPVLVAGHLDTVWSHGTLETMPYVVNGTKAHGPGIYDMKAGSFLAFHAVRSILRQRIKTPRPIVLLLTPDEEVGSPTSRWLIEQEAAQAAMVLIPEPAGAGGACVTARKGVGRFTMRVEGRGSHCRQRVRGWRLGDRGVVASDHRSAPDGGYRARHHAERRAGLGRIAAERDFPGCGVRDRPAGELRRRRGFDGGAAAGSDREDPRLPGDCRGRDEPAAVPGKSGDLGALRPCAGRCAAGRAGVAEAASGRWVGRQFLAALGVPTLDGLGCPGSGAHASHEHILWGHLAQRAALMAGLLETLA